MDSSPYPSPDRSVLAEGLAQCSAGSAVVAPPQRPLRVCYVITTINTPQAGTEGHLLRLIRRLDRRIVEPHLVILQQSAWSRQFCDSAVPTTVFNFRSFWKLADWQVVPQLRGLFQRLQTDIVELHFTDAHLVGALAARWAGIPVVIGCRRDLGHQLGLKERFLHRIGNRFVHHFAANSQEVVRHFAQFEHIPPELFTVVHNGLDLALFDETAETALPEHFDRLLRTHPVVVMAANLRPVKNHTMLLQAAQHVLKSLPRARFLLLGAGAEQEHLQRQAHELGIEQEVWWAGSVPHTAPYLRRAILGCLTSWTEGFSNSILEYMAAGIPVIATRTGGAAEAIEEGRTGFLIPPGDVAALADRITFLLTHPARVEEMGIASRSRVEELFSMSAQLENHYRLYHGLMQAQRCNG